MKIHATTPAQADYNDFSTSGAHYFADTLLCVQIYNDSIVITDVAEAMKAGKKCKQVKFQAPWMSHRCEVANLLRKCGYHFPTLFNLLAALGPADCYKGYEVQIDEELSGKGWVSDREAIRTYSPFAKLNPLKENPKKWTVAHVVRALVNGQYSHLTCNGIYSDDYAFDNAYNYFKGSTGATHLIEELVSDPSGWWAYEKEGGVSMGCHSFKSYYFNLDLAATPTIEEQVRRVVADSPNSIQAEQKHGNTLIQTGCPKCADKLGDLYTALRTAGRNAELDTEGPYTYLAIYQQKPVMAIA